MLIALGVSGGIAAYKACEIVRGLDRAGAEVQVILTRNGARFITPLTLQTLSRRRVLMDPFDPEVEETIQHIDLTRRISALVVAPATANALAKFAGGVADDFLSTFYVSVDAPVVLAPAMNTRMWLHRATQDNLSILRARGVRIVEPEHGWLAEGETGWGRLADCGRIVDEALAAAKRSRQLAGKKIVITAGPTRERIDPVRFLSNRSSGKMGFAIADACARRGADVHLISGPVQLGVPHGVAFTSVQTAEEMRQAVHAAREGAEAVFMVAAVGDYVPREQSAKIKRTGGELTLTLDEAPDILAELGLDRKERLLVGFAAETEHLLDNAREKLERKNLDYIVANDVSLAGSGFDADQNAVTVLGRDGACWEIARRAKAEIAETLVDKLFGVGPAEVAG